MIPPEIEARIPELEARYRGKGKHSSKASLREFLTALYENEGSAYRTAKVLGMSHQMTSDRRKRIEQDTGIAMPRGRPETWKPAAHNQTTHIKIENGSMLLISDTHFWPGVYSTAWAAFVGLAESLKPTFICIDGDGIDGCKTSRHPPNGWEDAPNLVDEIREFQDRLQSVQAASPSSRFLYAPGNHDVGRLDRYVAMNAPELKGLPGLSFKDFVPAWDFSGRFVINDYRKHKGIPYRIPTIIKHAFKRSGIHATRNAVQDEGCHIIHGHLHKQLVSPVSNYNGDMYGVDLGVGAAVDGPQFHYMQANTTGWRSGGALLTWENYEMQPPELFTTTNEEEGKFRFRGVTYTVEWR